MGSGVSVAAEVDQTCAKSVRRSILDRKVVVLGAETTGCNGIYSVVRSPTDPSSPMMHNDAWVFENSKGFKISREVVGNEPGWIIGIRPTAYYGRRDSALTPPTAQWKGGGDFAGIGIATVYDDVDNDSSTQKISKLSEKMILGTKKKTVRPPPLQPVDENVFYPVSPERRPKAWATPTSQKSILKENWAAFERPNMSKSQKRKGNRYDYYKKRIAKPGQFDTYTPKRVDPLDFI